MVLKVIFWLLIIWGCSYVLTMRKRYVFTGLYIIALTLLISSPFFLIHTK